MNGFYKILFILILTVCASGANAQRVRVAGLEVNPDYIALLEQEKALHRSQDSLSKAISQVRVKFRDDRENRVRHSDDLLRLESEIFDIRNRIGIVGARRTALEQEFIISDLGRVAPLPMDTITSAADTTRREEQSSTPTGSVVITDNDFFGDNLPENVYNDLVRAQGQEQTAANYIKIYRTNYTTLSSLAEQYAQTEDRRTADSLLERYLTLDTLNKTIADTVSTIFNRIFDNKTYAYNLLLDRTGRREMIERFENMGLAARSERESLSEGAMDEGVVSYLPYKRLLLDYEISLAKESGLSAALDSLTKAQEQMARQSGEYKFPRVALEERLFIDYTPISTSKTPVYNSSNPIPPVEIYDKGTIYRLFLGRYTKQQPVSLFRGASPIAYFKDEQGRFSYYLGGFRTSEQVEAAAQQARKIGFRNPRPVVWIDGVYSEQASRPGNIVAVKDKLFRVEIKGGGETLSELVRETIAHAAPGKDIMLAGEVFLVSPFANAAEAEKVAEALRSVDPQLEVSTSSIDL